MIELAAGIVVFLLIFFALMDFGRMTYNWVTAEKAVQMAARMAAVRPPVCADVPLTNEIADGSTEPYGSLCTALSNPCVAPPTRTCTGTTTAGSTGRLIFDRVAGLLPGGATPANLRYTYSYDRNMNFLGGPYVPLVTVELTSLRFEFVSPLAGLAMAAGAVTDTRTDGLISFPPMSVSLPGEDLAVGTDG